MAIRNVHDGCKCLLAIPIIFLQIRLALSRGTILQRASFADIVSVNKDTWKEVVGGVPNLIKKMRSCSK